MSKVTKETNTKTDLPTDPNVEVVVLESPIIRGESTIDSLSIRKPNTGSLRGLKLARVMELDVDSMITLLPRISNPPITEQEAATLEPADLVSVSTAVIGFFANSTQLEKINHQTE